MKICYLCADLGISLNGYKGASAHVRGLVRAFTNLGHEVLVITPSKDEPMGIGVPVYSIPIPEIVDAISYRAKPRLFRSLMHLWNNVAVEQALRDTLVDYSPDVIYERYSPFAVAGVIMGKRMAIPHILEVNAPLAWEGRKYRKQALHELADALEQMIFSSASLIVAVSREMREELLAVNGTVGRIAVVPNGVDLDMFSPRGPAYRQGLDEKVVIGFVGSLKPWHGLEILAEAFRRIARDTRIHLLVVGDGPMAKILYSLKEEFPDQISLVGVVQHSEVASYIRAMDIAVAPYPQLDRFYFSPLKLLEYMAAGRAIVATGIGQINELIKDGKTGILVPPGKPIALADSIHKLVSEPDLRSALGEEARKEALRSHSWMKRASKIIKLAETLT